MSSSSKQCITDIDHFCEILARRNDWDEYPKNLALDLIFDWLFHEGVPAFTALDIRNIVARYRKQDKNLCSISEKEAEKYLKKRVGWFSTGRLDEESRHHLGVKDGIYKFDDKEYIETFRKKVEAARLEKSGGDPDVIVAMNTWLREYETKEVEHAFDEYDSDPDAGNAYALTYRIKKNDTKEQLSINQFKKLVKAYVNRFDIMYPQFMAYHWNEQADGHSFLRNGRDLHNMLNGIGQYQGAGSVFLRDASRTIFQTFINKTIAYYFAEAVGLNRNKRVILQIGKKGISLQFNAKHPPDEQVINNYRSSLLHSYIEELFEEHLAIHPILYVDPTPDICP